MKNAFLVVATKERDFIKPGQPVTLLARPYVPLRPHRLRIDPTIAPFFKIMDVRVGTHSMFPWSQDVPASQFMHGAGDNYDIGIIEPSMDLLMTVLNVSDRVPDGPRGGVALPFEATWACLVVPFDESRRNRSTIDGDISDGQEHLGSRLDRIQGVTGRPLPDKRREPAGFGWDPGYD